MQKLRSDQSVHLPLVHPPRVVDAHQRESVVVDLEHCLRGIEAEAQLDDKDGADGEDEEESERCEVDRGAEGIAEHDVVALLVGVHHCHLARQEQYFVLLDVRNIFLSDAHSKHSAVHLPPLTPHRAITILRMLGVTGNLSRRDLEPVIADNVVLHAWILSFALLSIITLVR